MLTTRYNTYLRVSYFWTQINRPITALTVSSTPTLITEVRENLGQIESRGVSLDAETAPLRWLSLIGGYQYAYATVTKFSQQAVLSLAGILDYDAHRLPHPASPSKHRDASGALQLSENRRAQSAGAYDRKPIRQRPEHLSLAQLLPARRLCLSQHRQTV